MLEEELPLNMPVRSRLYALPMEGNGSVAQEGVLDYAQRLAHVHGLRVRHLLAEVILPEAQMHGAFFIPKHFSAHALRGCSGWSRYGVSFLGAMQRLTGRSDLANGSLAQWAALFSDQGYSAMARRWCPECLRAQRPRGVLAFSLLWSFEPVRVCPTHLIPLAECCPRCCASQPLIGDAVVLGACRSCRHLLSDDSRPAGQATQQDLFNARTLAGMIAAGERAAGIANPVAYMRAMESVAEELTDGSLFRLERTLNLAYYALQASNKHGLKFVLEVMYRLGVELMPFLERTAAAQIEPHVSREPYRAQRRYQSQEKACFAERVSEQLRQSLNETSTLTTRTQFVRDAGISTSYLQTNFPDVVSQLRAHNDTVRPAVHEALWEQRAQRVEEVVASLVARNGPFTASALSKALAVAGLHRRNPRVRKLASEALHRHLGMKPSQPHKFWNADDLPND